MGKARFGKRALLFALASGFALAGCSAAGQPVPSHGFSPAPPVQTSPTASPTPFQPTYPSQVPTQTDLFSTPTPGASPVDSPGKIQQPTANPATLPQILLSWQSQCSAPGSCAQLLLDKGWTYYESDLPVYGVDDFIASPYKSLSVGAGDCEDDVMLMAAGLMDDGYRPLALLITSDTWPANNHAVFPYQDNRGLWGYVTITKREVSGADVGSHVVDVQPQFLTLEALFVSYQSTHPWKHPYTDYYLVDLNLVPDWLTSEKPLIFYGNSVIADNVQESAPGTEPPSAP